MAKKISLTLIFITLGLLGLEAQTINEYPHCKCIEKIDEQYQLICSNKQIVTGQYSNGLKSGQWITKTAKGVIIKNAVYVDNKLNGKYELFHFDGTPKLNAAFVDGQQDGAWRYFNEKGKVIKSGTYRSGVPVGTWTIFDKNGKKAMATYDFDGGTSSNTIAQPYFKNGGIQRDDQSGEWYILHYPQRNPQSEVQPFGGYALACDFFLEYLTIPATMMDTYVNLNFGVTLVVEDNSVKSVKSEFLEKFTYNPKSPALPFIVSTNPPSKLTRVEHKQKGIDLLRENIEEVATLMGPWIGNSTVDVYVPFVLNDIKRF